MSLSFTWLGHSAFRLDVDGRVILIDPWISNPLSPIRPEDVTPDVILLSHGHGDHLGDTIAIANRAGAQVITNYEIANWLKTQGVENALGMNTGGRYVGDFFSVKLTIAHHSSSLPDGTYAGNPHGFVIEAGGYRLYYSGDTCPFSEMEWIGDMGIDVAFLPIGDLFTMGIGDSIKAIELVRPRFVVPMHYATFPPIVQDAGAWAKLVNANTGATPIVLDPGGKYTVS